MLLAAALTAVVVGGVLGIVAHLARDGLRMRAAQPDPSGRILELLRRDAACAQSAFAPTGAGFIEFVGTGGIDPQTHAPDFRPARVRYYVAGESGRWSLRRAQVYLDEPGPPGDELVCLGVRELQLLPAPSASARPDGRPPEWTGNAAPVPDCFRLRLTTGEQAVERTIVVR